MENYEVRMTAGFTIESVIIENVDDIQENSNTVDFFNDDGELLLTVGFANLLFYRPVVVPEPKVTDRFKSE